LLYVDSPLLEQHRDVQDDLMDAAQAAADHAAAHGARLVDAAKKS
jgi:hypothetical protein